MPDSKFILCQSCNAAHRVSAFDRAPLFARVDGDLHEVRADDRQRFMTAHAGHRLEPWRATGRCYYPDGSGGADPMARGYVEITDGKSTTLVERWRASIDESLSYRPVAGRLSVHSVTLEIQERALRKELERHFDWAPAETFGGVKIEEFLSCYRQVLALAQPCEVEPQFYPVGDDSVAQAPLDESLADALIAACQARFDAQEMIALRRFIGAHRDADDVLAPLVRRRFTIVCDSASVESLAV